jgi:hypothetical protein
MTERAAQREPLGNLEDFRECAGIYAWMHQQGWITLQGAVDNVQHLAELWGMVDDVGQDEVQAEMAFAFMSADQVEPSTDYGTEIMRRWELADSRDRWKHTGEPPPPPEQPAPVLHPYRTPQATIDAFEYVVRLGDPETLRKWLRDHPHDAPFLRRMLEAA